MEATHPTRTWRRCNRRAAKPVECGLLSSAPCPHDHGWVQHDSACPYSVATLHSELCHMDRQKVLLGEEESKMGPCVESASAFRPNLAGSPIRLAPIHTQACVGRMPLWAYVQREYARRRMPRLGFVFGLDDVHVCVCVCVCLGTQAIFESTKMMLHWLRIVRACENLKRKKKPHFLVSESARRGSPARKNSQQLHKQREKES